MEENSGKKGFFSLLEPRSAALVGAITGVLALCTIGFVVMIIMALSGGLNCSSSAKASDLSTLTDNGAAATGQAAEQAAAEPAPQTDKPKAELFVMAYCPYGLQMEKAFLPVMELLKGKADMTIRFVSYAMHGKNEIDENTRQYCIQKEQNAKLISYLKCFAESASGDSAGCITKAGVNQNTLNACVANADKQFGITAKFDDQSSWLSGRYPIFPVDLGLNSQYKIEGSPTLVINGVVSEAARNPEAVKQAICAAFKTQPAACKQGLSTASATAGFGAGTGADTGSADCGS